jgi:molecular chaperone GrpE
LDNLEHALTVGRSVSVAKLRHGVGLALMQLRLLLRQHGIEAEKSLGQHYDPELHEAVAFRKDPTQPDRTVLEVAQRGYRCGAQVFRPAKVVVNDLSQKQ